MGAITYEENNKLNNDKSNESGIKINKAVMLNEKEYIKSQQSIIDDFYKEYYTYDISNVGYWLVAGIFTFIQIVFMAVPFEEFYVNGKPTFINASDDRGLLAMMAFLFVFPVFFYMQPFVVGNLNGRVGSIYSQIKYLPVSLKAVRLYRFKKMLKFVIKVFIGCAVLQLGISLIAFHRIMWQTFVYLFIYGFLIPFLVGICSAIGGGEVYFNKV